MKKTTKELKDKTLKELEGEIQSLRIDITRLRLQAKSNPPKDTNTLPKKKKRLAVVLTMLVQKKELEKLEKVKNVESKKTKKT